MDLEDFEGATAKANAEDNASMNQQATVSHLFAGRPDLDSEDDVSFSKNDWEESEVDPVDETRDLMRVSSSDNGKVMTGGTANSKEANNGEEAVLTPSSSPVLAEKLRKDLNCVICNEVTFPPATLMPCGHTFCRPCIEWWLYHAAGQCPICNHRAMVVSVNLPLKLCIMSIFGPEIIQRTQNETKVQPVQFQLVKKLKNARWHNVNVSLSDLVSPDSKGSIWIRRNVVVDAEFPQRYFALAIYGKPIKDIADSVLPAITDDRWFDHMAENGGELVIQVCLLAMKKDKTKDSRFPINVLSSENKRRMCKSDPFRHSYLNLYVKDHVGNLLPLARATTNNNNGGTFKYFVNPSRFTVYGTRTTITNLVFEHSPTGLELEVDLSKLLKQARSAMEMNRARYTFEYDMDEDE